MAANITKPGTDGKKITILHDAKEVRSIMKELKRRKDAGEHGATLSAIFRDLVRTGLPS